VRAWLGCVLLAALLLVVTALAVLTWNGDFT